jgi:VWFA-related protein
MRILLPSCLIASAFAVPALYLAAQQQPAATPPSRPAFTKPAREVILPVLVRDKHGDVVTNLTAADFTLTEDGHPQTIQSFGTQTDVPFAIGMLVDTSRTVEPGLTAERSAAEKFVAQMLPADSKAAQRNDQMFLIHFDNEVELLEDFTNSREKIDQELESMGPTAAEHNSPQGPETNDSGGYGGHDSDRASHGGTQVYDAVYLASDQLMKPKPGRKVLVVFSDGVDRSSKETQSDAIDAAEHANTIVYAIYFRGGDERQSSFPGMGRHGGMSGGGYPGSGGGWPGSSGGNTGGGRTQQAPVDGKKVMQDIASRTGGQFFEAKKTANFEEIYNEIAKQLQGQYVLTYVSDQKDDDEGTYHKIVLKPKRDDLTVITREGYYAPGGDSK